MIIPKEAWKRKIGEPLESPGTGKIIGPEGGLPNFDDGYYQGIPLGGLGAGTICQSYRGDFSKWHLEIGKHIYKTIFPCQFAFYENGNAVVLNEYKPPDGSLSAWNFQRPNGNYHALYPIAIFEYKDLSTELAKCLERYGKVRKELQILVDELKIKKIDLEQIDISLK